MGDDAMALTGLHVLIDPERLPAERLPLFLEAIIRGGAAVVQVRIKEGSTRDALDYIARVKELVRGRLTLIINDRVDWALAVGADGVHLGQDDMPLEVVRRLFPDLMIGASAGSPSEVRAVLRHRPNYIGLGPVFVTPSKADAGAPLGVEGLRALVRSVPATIVTVAIGGIEPKNVAAVWDTGVGGVAVIHAVTGARDPEEAAHALGKRHGARS
jgi:thiamine-phosphate pyrophosphorylase